MAEPRIRDVWSDYQKGAITFDQVMRVVDTFLEQYEQRRPTAVPDREQGPVTSRTARSDLAF